jgi:hypothetical protein
MKRQEWNSPVYSPEEEKLLFQIASNDVEVYMDYSYIMAELRDKFEKVFSTCVVLLIPRTTRSGDIMAQPKKSV